MAEVIKFEDAAKAFERDNRVTQLLIGGVSPRRIAHELGISIAEVHAAHTRMMGAMPSDYRARQVELMVQRKDAILRTFMPKMLNGDIEAAKLILRADDSRAEVLGLRPLPTRDEPMSDLKNQETTTEQLERVLDEIQKKRKPVVIDAEAVVVENERPIPPGD